MSLANHGLRTAIYKVPDLAEGKAWYENAFQTEPYFDEPTYVGFNIGGFELGLLPGNGAGGADRNSGGVKQESGVTAYWGVGENIESEVARLVALGAILVEPPTNVGGAIVVAAVQDPWGNTVGLIYNPTFEIPQPSAN